MVVPPVHPHGRGEHLLRAADAGLNLGSSPRAWGTWRAVAQDDGRQRFIPTGVGNMSACGRCARAAAVHPHGRGEHSWVASTVYPHRGSSPRAWGTCVIAIAPQRPRRFIPTGVGNIARKHSVHDDAPVHPHGRGEHCSCQHGFSQSPGSSPRAWGTLHGAEIGGMIGRFIPTGVGNMCACRKMAGYPSVHPHGRGEHLNAPATPASDAGSSPRAWGTCPVCMAICPPARFIPTGVGNIIAHTS